ncbi:3603_t:CDS:1, partial [Diversispora eburnea]
NHISRKFPRFPRFNITAGTMRTQPTVTHPPTQVIKERVHNVILAKEADRPLLPIIDNFNNLSEFINYKHCTKLANRNLSLNLPEETQQLILPQQEMKEIK